jgi:hypothetical protein
MVACSEIEDTVEAWESPPGNDWVQVVAGSHNAMCGLHGDGSARCWGRDADFGMEPPRVPLTQMDVLSLPCGVSVRGTISCGYSGSEDWGEEVDLSALTDGTTYQDVAVGGDFYCGLSDEGVMMCVDNCGILLDVSGHGGYTSISAGWISLCGLKNHGSYTCWDMDGVGYSVEGRYMALEAGYDNGACGITEEGALDCWGIGFIQSDPGPFIALSVGDSIACAIRAEGAIRCWWGGPIRTVEPPSDGPFIGVAASNTAVCGLRSDGGISCAKVQQYEL